MVLKVFGRKSSFNVQKVMWLVGELRLEHEHIEKGGAFGGLDAPSFRAKNPHARVPVIDDDGVIVWESHAIMRYLAARYGAGTYWHDDPVARASVDQWLDWSQCRLQPDFLSGVFWGFYRTPAAHRDQARVADKIADTGRHMELLDSEIASNRYLIGEQPSLADIAIATNFYRYFNIDIKRPNVPNVMRWFEALEQRPAYQAHVMIPFDDLYGRLDY